MTGLIIIGYDGSDEAGHAIDAAATILRATRRVAQEGAQRASDAGLLAHPEIVVGRRGVSRLEAIVLGSVSNDTVRESRRPVLVVPFSAA